MSQRVEEKIYNRLVCVPPTSSADSVPVDVQFSRREFPLMIGLLNFPEPCVAYSKT